MEKNHETAITQMRKSLEKLGISTQNYNDATLLRFLIARSIDIGKATKMFDEWTRWRDEFVPLGFIPDSEVPDELGDEKMYLQGLSAIGQHPVLMCKASKHFPSKDQLQFKKFVVHLLDKTIASFKDGKEIGNEKLISILDLEKISYKNVDARGFIIGFQFLQAYYPERLAKAYLLNMPWFFVRVWKMISYFLEKATQEKIVIVCNEEQRKDFVYQVGEDALTEDYGGRGKLVLVQDVTVDHFPIPSKK
ncbi:CRAL-TRIO domain-containing protein YKL091C-like [Papaver somniferum]|uniref:CRAL-TRIO domain-containing protein YKL091C-like n=1 Tax=Papaver somniferum TaxID=3469 RepID=UPI000E6F6DFF|nr:CRAL-TRIO domain-containing protein YKL091C-like [Papaver somniferum]